MKKRSEIQINYGGKKGRKCFILKESSNSQIFSVTYVQIVFMCKTEL